MGSFQSEPAKGAGMKVQFPEVLGVVLILALIVVLIAAIATTTIPKQKCWDIAIGGVVQVATVCEKAR